MVRQMKELQRAQNKAMSHMVNELPYIQAFNKFYHRCSFAWIPKWLQKWLKPMAYRCFKAGGNYERQSSQKIKKGSRGVVLW
jgi:hypothetical protein